MVFTSTHLLLIDYIWCPVVESSLRSLWRCLGGFGSASMISVCFVFNFEMSDLSLGCIMKQVWNIVLISNNTTGGSFNDAEEVKGQTTAVCLWSHFHMLLLCCCSFPTSAPLNLTHRVRCEVCVYPAGTWRSEVTTSSYLCVRHLQPSQLSSRRSEWGVWCCCRNSSSLLNSGRGVIVLTDGLLFSHNVSPPGSDPSDKWGPGSGVSCVNTTQTNDKTKHKTDSVKAASLQQ